MTLIQEVGRRALLSSAAVTRESRREQSTETFLEAADPGNRTRDLPLKRRAMCLKVCMNCTGRDDHSASVVPSIFFAVYRETRTGF